MSRVGQLVAHVGPSASVPCWTISEYPVLDSQCECPVLDKVIVAHVPCRTKELVLMSRAGQEQIKCTVF